MVNNANVILLPMMDVFDISYDASYNVQTTIINNYYNNTNVVIPTVIMSMGPNCESCNSFSNLSPIWHIRICGPIRQTILMSKLVVYGFRMN